MGLIAVYSPGLLVNLIIFCWMLGALRKIAEDLDGESRSLFKKVRAIMILGFLAAIPSTALQLLELGGALSEELLPSRTAFKWHYQWFLFDGVGQIIYGVVFMSEMCQWAPQNETQKYLCSEQVNMEDDGDDPKGSAEQAIPADAPADAFAIEDDDVEMYHGKPPNRKGTAVAPRRIGANDDDDN